MMDAIEHATERARDMMVGRGGSSSSCHVMQDESGDVKQEVVVSKE